MRKLVYILLFICFSVNAQKVTQTEYFNLLDADSVFISQHSTRRGAENKARSIPAKKEIDTFHVKGDWQRLIFDHRKEMIPISTTNLEFIGISATSITETSATILIELNSQVFDFAYVKFKKEGDTIWEETNKDKSAIISSGLLIPNSNYEYQVFASDNGVEIKSMKLYFKTE